MMIVVMGEARFGAGEIDRLAEVLRRTIEATRAEPGCAYYSYARDLIEPDLLRISERWTDEAAFETHLRTPHMAELGAALRTAQIEALDLGAYQARFLRIVLGG
jgi:quinol monooxygenase YgiN